MFHPRNLSRFLSYPIICTDSQLSSQFTSGHWTLSSLSFPQLWFFSLLLPMWTVGRVPPTHTLCTHLACTRHIHLQLSFKKSDWAIFLCSLCLQRPTSVKSCMVSTQGTLHLPLHSHCPSFRQCCHQPPRYSFKSLELS